MIRFQSVRVAYALHIRFDVDLGLILAIRLADIVGPISYRIIQHAAVRLTCKTQQFLKLNLTLKLLKIFSIRFIFLNIKEY